MRHWDPAYPKWRSTEDALKCLSFYTLQSSVELPPLFLLFSDWFNKFLSTTVKIFFFFLFQTPKFTYYYRLFL